MGGEADKKRGKNKEQLIDDEAEEEGEEEEGEGSTEAVAQKPRTVEEVIAAIDGYVEDCLNKASGFKGKTTASATLLRTIEREFYKAVPQTCQNCKASNPGFRKEGYLKVFEKKESDKMRRRNEGKGLTRQNILDFVKAPKKDGEEPQPMETTDDGDESSEAEEDNEIPEADSDDEDGPGVNGPNPMRTMSRTETDESGKKPSGDRYLTPLEIKAHMDQLWTQETMILDLIFGQVDAVTQRKISSSEILFFELIPVAPTKFRPASKMGDQTYDHPQNTNLTKILKANALIADLRAQNATGDRILRTWMDLQGEINTLFDTSKAGDKARNSPPGIRQILEKKEGLFRKHMMGKRVNYAARSVISPDIMVEGNEIGIPPYFATRLTYPSPVTPHNVHILRQAVINGPKKWPGATHIQQEDGHLLSLERLDEVARTALANSLLTSPHTSFNSPFANVPKVVHRHLINGDFLLLNRQPTLHKPSIMAHTARILKGEKTLRMHYAK
jgi:DNA-directed RNA polymerase I subunit RPA1